MARIIIYWLPGVSSIWHLPSWLIAVVYRIP
jgi:hypothetical protein